MGKAKAPFFDGIEPGRTVMDNNAPKSPRKPSVVYDLRMPGYRYRDDRGEAKTVGVERPKDVAVKFDSLGNLTL